MANLPETPTYASGIYQLEVVDPVLGGSGGISNTQAQMLGNRTAYLKQHLDTAEANISANTTAIAGKADLNSPAFTGTPTAPTPVYTDNSTKLATTAYTNQLLAVWNATFTSQLNLKAPLASPTFTGIVQVPNATAGDSSTIAANTAFVTNAVTTATSTLAPRASPTFTGVPAAPTATAGTNTTQIATTAFVTTAVADKLSKSGDQGTGAYGINIAPNSPDGLHVAEVTVDAGFAARLRGDVCMQPNPSSSVDKVSLYLKNKAGTNMGTWSAGPTALHEWYDSASVNKALVDLNGNFIGGNIEAGGTWTPTINGTTTAGAGTYTTRVGTYAIIGNCILLNCNVTWTAHTGTGNMTVTGLPAGAVNITSAEQIFPCRMTTNVASTELQLRMAAGATAIDIQSRTTSATTGFAAKAITAANTLQFTILYRYR